MNETTPQGTIEQYAGEFNNKTNYGRVLTADISRLVVGEFLSTLTPIEEKERQEWAEIRPGLRTHYSVEGPRKGIKPSEMLLLPIAPPLLNDRTITTRTTKKGARRVFLERIGVWDDFENEVQSFTVPEAIDVKGAGVDGLFRSLDDDDWTTNEIEEMGFIMGHVLRPLRQAGLLKHRTRAVALDKLNKEANSRQQAAPVPDGAAGPVPQDAAGQRLSFADHFLMAGVTTDGMKKLVPIEFSASHNLPVPNTAEVLVDRYNRMDSPNHLWTNIAHRLSQLIFYMFFGGSHYGVLTSGTRSYFVKVEVTNGIPRVLITRAWFIGQPNFLRAWAYLFDLATGDGYFEPSPDWLGKWKCPPLKCPPLVVGVDNDVGDNTGQDPDQPGDNADGDDDVADDRTGDGTDDKEDKRPPKRPKSDDQEHGTGGPSSEHKMAWLDPGLAPSIPRVDGEEIRTIRLLADGNHADVYLARWKGKEVAVKVFDYFKGLQQYKSEIRAYEHLKEAWGVLVPEPYFVADWWGHLALGIQLGRIPNSSDRKFYSDLDDLFSTLRRDYAFAHLDEEPRNSIYIPDKSRKGKDRLVAIDLEYHEIHR